MVDNKSLWAYNRVLFSQTTGVNMTKKISIKVFADPGHAWARFPKAKLVSLGIADKISTYSYMNGPNAFLEEDCDLSVLIKVLRDLG